MMEVSEEYLITIKYLTKSYNASKYAINALVSDVCKTIIPSYI